jgi:uncharacterized protein (UPF0332 family)
MEYSKKELSHYRLQRAKEDLEAAKKLFANNMFVQSINRSYYSIFHSTRALLAFDQFDSKKHSGVIHFFHQNYIADGKIDHLYGKILTMAFSIRTRSDYHDFFIASKVDAETQIQNAEKFISMVENYLSKILEK